MWDHKGTPMWRTIVRWMVLNLAAEWVCAQLGPKRTMRLRYEDFVADPKGALERIGSLIELDLTDVADAASSGKPMQAGHNVGGNRTKKSDDHNAATGARRGMEDGTVRNRAATFMDVDGMAHAPIRIR